MFPTASNRPQQTQKIGGSYPYDPYQVQRGDTFQSIADTTGTNLDALQNANPGLTVPPPNGSYINLPSNQNINENVFSGTGYNLGAPVIQSNNEAAPLSPSPTPSPPGFNNPHPYHGGSAQPAAGTPPQYSGIGWGALASQPGFTQAQAQAEDLALNSTVNSLKNGVNPPNLSQYVVNKLVNPTTGQKFTPTELSKLGYSFNPATGGYTLASDSAKSYQQQMNPSAPFGGLQNTGGSQNTDFSQTATAQYNAANGISYENQKRWDPKTKKFVRIGTLIKQGKFNDRKTPEQIRKERQYAIRQERRRARFKAAQKAQQQQQPQEPAPVVDNTVIGAGATPGEQLNTNQAGG